MAFVTIIHYRFRANTFDVRNNATKWSKREEEEKKTVKEIELASSEVNNNQIATCDAHICDIIFLFSSFYFYAPRNTGFSQLVRHKRLKSVALICFSRHFCMSAEWIESRTKQIDLKRKYDWHLHIHWTWDDRFVRDDFDFFFYGSFFVFISAFRFWLNFVRNALRQKETIAFWNSFV